MTDETPTNEGCVVRVGVRTRKGSIVEAVHRLSDAGLDVEDLTVRRPTLDDVFLALTGHAAEDAEPEEIPADGRGRRRPERGAA